MSAFRILLGIILTMLAATPAFAHPGHMAGAGLVDGFAHPFSGWDHMLAMTGLGLWLGQGRVAQFYVALGVFVAALGAGFVLGLNGFHLPFVEAGILASVLVFGLLMTASARLPAAIAAPVIAFFTIFHGHAHGAEAPAGASPLYALGFIAASIMIVTAAFALVHFFGHSRQEAS